MMSEKCLFVLITAFVFVFQVGSVAWAVPLPTGTPVLIVDGDGDPDATVTITFANLLSGFTFGQLSGGGFVPIISGVTPLAGGTLVDFAVRQDALPNAVASLTVPNGATITGDLMGPIPFANSQSPVVGTDYYNSLTLVFSSFGLPFSIQVLNGNGVGGTDGFAAVPIPPAALLFGTGLIGLIGIARKSVFLK